MHILLEIQAIIKPLPGRYVLTYDIEEKRLIEIYQHTQSPSDGFGIVPSFLIDEALKHELLHPREDAFWRAYDGPTSIKRPFGEAKTYLDLFIKKQVTINFSTGHYRTYGEFTLSIKSLGSHSRLSTPPHRLKGELAPIHGDSAVAFIVK